MLIHRRGKRGGACDIALPFWDDLAASHELHSMRRYGMPRRKGKICPRKDSNTRVHRSRARNTPSGHQPVNGPTIEGGFAITGAKHRLTRSRHRRTEPKDRTQESTWGDGLCPSGFRVGQTEGAAPGGGSVVTCRWGRAGCKAA